MEYYYITPVLLCHTTLRHVINESDIVKLLVIIFCIFALCCDSKVFSSCNCVKSRLSEQSQTMTSLLMHPDDSCLARSLSL